MEKLRYNTFNKIHKGLRNLLFETAIQTQQTDFTDNAQLTSLIKKINEIIDLFEGHAHAEDNFVFSTIKEINPSLVDLLEAEHEKDHQLGEGLRYWVNTVQGELTSEERKAAGFGLMIGLNEFIAFNLSHMNKEETLINEVMWDTYTDAEIIANEQKLVAQIPPEKMMRYAKWMLKGLGTHEIIDWYSEIRMAAPEAVYTNMCRFAKEVLPSARWNEIMISLNEEAPAIY